MPVCACLFYVGHVRVYSSLEAVGWCWYVIMVITGLFLYVCFLQNNHSLSLHISICLLLDTIAYLTMMGALSYIQKSMRVWPGRKCHRSQTNPRPTATCRRDREKDGKKHRIQTATKLTKHPPDLTPAQNDWSNNMYYKNETTTTEPLH